MNNLFIDAYSGISGNMFIGALLDLGASVENLKENIDKLNLDGYDLIIEKVEKQGVSATYFDVKLHHHHHDDDEHHHHHRGLSDIISIIDKSSLDLVVKQKSIEIFTRLATAEAKVHNMPIEQVHFHEVGAVDTIIDVIGSIVCLTQLEIENIYISKICTGFGFVKCAHGTVPVPAPATAELLKEIPFYSGEVQKELATPTGVAIAATLAQVVSSMPDDFLTEKIGYGAGSYDLPVSNTLRMFKSKQILEQCKNKLIVLETNIDDMNPQVYGHVMNKLFAAGAYDVWITPTIMKKGRPACVLSVILQEFLLDDISSVIFTETSSLGVRYYFVDRKVLDRKSVKVELPYGRVHLKCGILDGKIVNVMPEFDDCSNISAITGLPIKKVWQDAMQIATKDSSDC